MKTENKNPIFRELDKQPGFAYDEGVSAYQQAGVDTAVAQQAPPPTVRAGRPLTIDDVITKTGMSFVVLLVGAVIGWQLTPAMPWLPFVAMLVALGIFLFGAARRLPGAGVVLSYSLVEGVMLGGISMFFQDYAEANGSDANIIAQAVIGTFAAFGVMLVLYRTRIIRVTAKFTKILLVAMISYLVIALASLVASLFGVGQGWGFYGVGFLGVALCLIGAGLAAFSLMLDFDSIENAIRRGAPDTFAWQMSLGLLVTLVWLYLELLRLLAILSSNR